MYCEYSKMFSNHTVCSVLSLVEHSYFGDSNKSNYQAAMNYFLCCIKFM